jgi:hypothetical protein
MMLVNADNEPQGGGGFYHDPPGADRLLLVSQAAPASEAHTVFGQPLRLQTPNHLKPGDLDLKSAALDVWVPLDGAHTVGDLIQAVRKKAGLELYADARLARLPIALKGGAAPFARASDLLEALGWATTATYRQVGPTHTDSKATVYLLAFDREGLAIRRGRIREWAQRGNDLLRATKARFDAQIQSKQARQYLGFADGDLLALTTEAQENLSNSNPDDEMATTTVPASALTEGQRQQLADAIKKFQKNYPADASGSPQTDRVGVNLYVRMTILIPGVGELRSENIWSDNTIATAPKDSEVDPDQTKPIAGGHVIVSVAAPRDRAEAEALVQTTVSHGVRQLWIRLSSAGGTGTLGNCVAIGKTRHLPIVAMVPLMRVPAGSIPPLWSDINLFGETGPQWAAESAGLFDSAGTDAKAPLPNPATEVMNPSVPPVLAALKSRLAAVAAIPGLSGVTLSDAIAPGYGGSQIARDASSYGGDFGYSIENRLAFIRRKGFDPIDLDPYFEKDERDRLPIGLPFADDNGDEDDDSGFGPLARFPTVLAEWQDFLAEQQGHLLKTLRADLRMLSPTLAVFVETPAPADASVGKQYYRLWDKPDNAPLQTPTDRELIQQPSLIRTLAPAVVVSPSLFAGLPTEKTEDAQLVARAGKLASMLRDLLETDPTDHETPHLTTAVLDLTALPVAGAIALLKGVFLPAGNVGN